MSGFGATSPERALTRRRWSLSSRSLLVAAVPSVAIVVAVAGMFMANSAQSAATTANERADVVQVSAGRTLNLLLDAEAGVRGYGTANSISFLEPYDRAVKALPGALSSLRALVARDSAQGARVDSIIQLSDSELATLKALRNQIVVAGGRDDPSIGRLAAQGKATMDSIRRQVDDIAADAQHDEQTRRTHVHALDRLVQVIAIAAGALGALGGLVFAVALSRSERARRRAERDLATSLLLDSEDARKKAQLVIGATAVGLATVGLDGLCVAINPTGAALLGYDVEELIGTDVHSLTHHHYPDGRRYPAEQCQIRAAAQTHTATRVDNEVFWRKDGTRMAVEYSVTPLLGDGVNVGAVLTFSDISARTAVDEAAEAEAAELRHAIAQRQLVLHYQPKLSLANGELLGVEALVRWQHPTRGLVFPDDFIALAEQTGVIGDLTEFVLHEAVEQHASWRADGLDLPIAVNLSAHSLVDTQLPAFVIGLCQRNSVQPTSLELEITESAVMANPDRALSVLQTFADHGFPLTLDDFGTGFSSMAHLRDLPVSTVKIDKSFVMSLPSGADAHIVRGTIDLVHGLGKTVIAEGVETHEALEFLKRAGCDAGQGYYWSPAVPPGDLAQWVHQHKARIGPAIESSTLEPANEVDRLDALPNYAVLETAYQAIFNDIAVAAARIG